VFSNSVFKTYKVDPNYIINQLIRRRNRSERLTATTALLEKSSIALANFTNIKSSKRTIVPQGVKNAYAKHKKRANINIPHEDARLLLESLETLRERCGHSKSSTVKSKTESPKEETEKELIKHDFKAVFCPIGVNSKPILIKEKVTKIGTDLNCTVKLPLEGCRKGSQIQSYNNDFKSSIYFSWPTRIFIFLGVIKKIA
jgi:hypothetical protein